MKAFEYLSPATLDETVQVLSDYGLRAKVLAGGTDLITRIYMRKEEPPDYVVSLKKLKELDYIEVRPDGHVGIGALATLRCAEQNEALKSKFRALSEAVKYIGPVQIRNLGTVVGNICTASPAADAAIALLALDAEVEIVGLAGKRRVPLAEFFTGPRRNCLKAGELAREVCVPPVNGSPGSAFARVSPRRAMDVSVAAVAASLALEDDDTISQARIALGAVASTPVRASEAEQILLGKALDEKSLDEVGKAAAQQSNPITDIRGTVEYRREMVGVLTRRVVKEAHKRAKEGKT